jgi:hypothetical protein
VLASAETASIQAVSPDDALPVEIADQIMDVIDQMMTRLDRLSALVSETGPAGLVSDDPVAVCRKAMVDMTVEDKVIVADQLRGWVEAERGTHERQH